MKLVDVWVDFVLLNKETTAGDMLIQSLSL